MLLKAEKINKSYLRSRAGSNVFFALRTTDFELQEGAISVVMGKSGSGKSTMLSILSGLLAPSEGVVLLDGKDLYSMSDEELSALRNSHFGIMPQGQTVMNTLTVEENILLPCMLYGEKDMDIYKKRAAELMERLNITDLKDIMPTELSGGEIRRVSIARGLIREPQIILADEPTGDLDSVSTAIVLDLFRELAAKGCSVLLVTHEQEAISYADRFYIMEDGALREENR